MIKLLATFYILATINMFSLPSDSTHKQSPFILGIGYRLPVGKTMITNSGHGVCVEAGINPGYFLSEKLTLGLFAGWGWRDNLWTASFDDGFVRDYKSSINHEHRLPKLDSALISMSPDLFATKNGRSPAMPGCETKAFHDYSMYYGFIVKLPYSFFPVVKLYKGTSRSHYQGSGDMITKQMEYNIVQLRRDMYGCEIMVTNPLGYLFKKNNVRALKYMGFSVYYEYCDFYTSGLYFSDGKEKTLVALKRFTSGKFMAKYRHEHKFGCRVSFNII